MTYRLFCAGLLAIAGSVGLAEGQTPLTPQAHRARAQQIAGKDYADLYNILCVQMARPAAPPPNQRRSATRDIPPRAEWYAPPVKVFDNLYWVGQSDYSAWALTTSDGIILLDTLFGYSVESEIADGLRKLGLDPARIKYAVVSHGHGDHHGGAKYLQDHFGTRVLMGAADWDLVGRNTVDPIPKRDMVAVDGQKIQLGNTTVMLYSTPGHTPATISNVFEVTDQGRRHVVAEMGGTGFNFTISPDRSEEFWFRTYIESVQRFRGIAAAAGADVLISNHTTFDNSKRKLAAIRARKPGQPNPFVIGADSIRRYLTVQEECAKASLAALTGKDIAD